MCVFLVIILLVLSLIKLLESQRIENGCWPGNVVTFDLDPVFAENHKLLILDRMKHVSQQSCLRFINTRENIYFKETAKKFLQIRQSGSKYCRTIEEYKNGSIEVTIELWSGCMNNRGVLHELVHALGFRHEHQRVDRKCYVRVFWSKVTQVSAFAVDFNNPDNAWLDRFPYDKLSIMHYSRSTKLKARDERLFEWEPLGNSVGNLTWWDVWKINYKHCSTAHYCEVHPQQCAIIESYEKSRDCKINQ